MVERWLISSVFLVIIWPVAFSQDREEAAEPVLKSCFEVGLTPRFRYISFNNVAQGGGDDVYMVQWAPRIQVASEIYNNTYVILFYDWMARRTDESKFYGDDYDGHKMGLQLSYKFVNAYIEQYLFKAGGKKRYLRLYPETMIASGLSTLSSFLYSQDLRAGNGYYFFYEFTVGFNFVLNRFINLQFYKGVGLEPHERHYPYKYYTFFKIIYKI